MSDTPPWPAKPTDIINYYIDATTHSEAHNLVTYVEALETFTGKFATIEQWRSAVTYAYYCYYLAGKEVRVLLTRLKEVPAQFGNRINVGDDAFTSIPTISQNSDFAKNANKQECMDQVVEYVKGRGEAEELNEKLMLELRARLAKAWEMGWYHEKTTTAS